MEAKLDATPLIAAQEAERNWLVDCIRRGESCAVVGPSNLGKSHLLRTLFGEQAQRRLSAPGGPPVILVLVDALLAGDSSSAFYELLLGQINQALPGEHVPASTRQALREAYAGMLASTNPVALRALFLKAVRTLMHETDLRLWLLLDELDDAYRELPAWPFRTLRSLRDEFPGRLGCVIATARRLERLNPDPLRYEFREMFHAHTRLLRPYSPEHSALMYEHLAESQGYSDAHRYRTLVLELATGHPGMIKRSLQIVAQLVGEPEAPALQDVAGWGRRLLRAPAIQEECRRFWEDLESEEREALLAFTAGGLDDLDPLLRQLLAGRGYLIHAPAGPWSIFNPLLANYLQGELNILRRARGEGVHCDLESNRIYLHGEDITQELSELQRRLLRHLYQNANKVCGLEEIMEAVWRTPAGVSVGSLYNQVSRVREIIEPDKTNPTYLITVSGGGYTLQVSELL
jgi:hypothetical protein